MKIFKFELKKLFIKQHILLIIVILVLVKLLLSLDLFRYDYGHLSKGQQEIFLQYIQELGGELTEEKEDRILSLYSQLAEGIRVRNDHQEKLNRGELDDAEKFLESINRIPAIVGNEPAITLLFEKYKALDKNRDNSCLIASDAPAMRIGTDYLFLIFSCYVGAVIIFYERKTSDFSKTCKGNNEALFYRLICAFGALFLVQLLYTVVDFSALVYEIGFHNLSATVKSLDSFRNTPYPYLSILQAFLLIEVTRLLGAVFTAAVAMILMSLTKNIILSIFTPSALDIIWIYVFSNYTFGYFQPFALLSSPVYFTGEKYFEKTKFIQYETISPFVFFTIVTSAIVTIVIACFIVKKRFGGNAIKNKRNGMLLSVILILAMCTGCMAEDTQNVNSKEALWITARDNVYFSLLHTAVETDSMFTNKTNIVAYDDCFNLISERLNRDPIINEVFIKAISADKDFLYYLADDFKNGISFINRINLITKTEESVVTLDYGSLANGKPTYLDMITIWPAESKENLIIRSFMLAGNRLIYVTADNKVYSINVGGGNCEYLFEDIDISCMCMHSGIIYYLNYNNKITRYDGTKTVISEKQYNYITTDVSSGKLFCSGVAGLYSFDGNNGETSLIKSGDFSDCYLSADNGVILCFDAFDKSGFIISEDKTAEISDVDMAVIINGEIISDKGNNLSSKEMQYEN